MHFDINSIGLRDDDINGYVESPEELINMVSNSGRLYYKSVKYVLLTKIQNYLNDSTITEADKLNIYFPYKNRKKLWGEFRDQFDLDAPDLRLNKISLLLLILVLITGLLMLFASTDELIHLKLSDLNMSTILSGLMVLPLGLILIYGRTALPAKTIDELTDEVMKINMNDLLSEDKKKLKKLLMLNLYPIKRSH